MVVEVVVVEAVMGLMFAPGLMALDEVDMVVVMEMIVVMGFGVAAALMVLG